MNLDTIYDTVQELAKVRIDLIYANRELSSITEILDQTRMRADLAESQVAELRKECTRLRRLPEIIDTEALIAWKEEGEQMFGEINRRSCLFRIGVWWAERPWRKS